jgi:hypothetical protein
MFSNAKVGDRVWSFDKGWGTIQGFDNNPKYPILVDLDDSSSRSYTYDGKYFDNDINPNLFWNELKFEIPSKPVHKYKLVNGVKIPNTSFTPAPEDNYYYPYISNAVASIRNDNFCLSSNTDVSRANNGFCYPYTEEGKGEERGADTF